MRIVPLEEVHFGDCAALVAERYAALRRRVHLVPPRYEAAAEHVPRIAAVAAQHPGVAAFEGSRLVGFLSGWRIPSLRGERSVYCPEWANGAAQDARSVYQALYTVLAGQWVAQGYTEHAVSLFSSDVNGLEGWFWLGFGHYVTDAVRGLDPVSGPLADVTVRRATAADFPVLAHLEAELQAHLRSSPTFLPVSPDDDHAEMRAFVQSPANAVFLAERDGEPVGYMRLQPASTDACTIIRDAGTTSITGAYTVKAARGGGVARALLGAGLGWARGAGYERCAVDFESMNTLAAGFWLRHFQPVCTSLHRHVNPSVI